MSEKSVGQKLTSLRRWLLLLFPSFIFPIVLLLLIAPHVIGSFLVLYSFFSFVPILVGAGTVYGIPHILRVLRKVQQYFPVFRGKLGLTEKHKTTWDEKWGTISDFFNNVIDLSKRTGFVFFILFGIQIWIVKSSKIIEISKFSVFLILIMLLLVFVLPCLFYLIWSVQSAGVIMYQEEPPKIEVFGSSIRGTFLTLSTTSILIYIVRRIVQGAYRELLVVLLYDLISLVIFFPSVYAITGAYFLFFQDKSSERLRNWFSIKKTPLKLNLKLFKEQDTTFTGN